MKVTFEKDGVSCLSVYPDNMKTEDIISLLHRSDIRKQIAQYVRSEIKDLSNVSDMTLAYVIEELPKYHSRISNIKFYSNKRKFSNIQVR